MYETENVLNRGGTSLVLNYGRESLPIIGQVVINIAQAIVIEKVFYPCFCQTSQKHRGARDLHYVLSVRNRVGSFSSE